MKKNIISIIALLCAVLALLLAVFATQSLNTIRDDYNARLVALEAKIAILQENLTNTPGASGSLGIALESWSLTPAAWAEDRGADVTLEAQPENYDEDLAAVFLVKLGGNTVAGIPCSWDGTAYTATASLPAANGYSYYLELTSGVDRTEVPLSTAEKPSEPYCVDLEDSLSAYASLLLSDWTEEDGKLTLTAGFAEAKMPMLTPSGNIPTVDRARLVLRLDGEEIAAQDMAMEPGEAEGVYVVDLDNTVFQIQQPGENEELSLWIEVELSDGGLLEAYGVSWFAEDGQLYLVTG